MKFSSEATLATLAVFLLGLSSWQSSHQVGSIIELMRMHREISALTVKVCQKPAVWFPGQPAALGITP